MKQIAPIWKREFFEGGDVWIEGATADPDDAHGARPKRSGSHARDRAAVRAAARHRRHAPSWRARWPPARRRIVWRQLVREFPELARYERSISSAVNADYARMDRSLADGDEVAFLPPVSGG